MPVQLLFSFFIISILAAPGCNAVRSDAVRQLIEKQGEKIKIANRVVKEDFKTSIDQKIDALSKQFTDYDNALKHAQKIEAIHTFTFSSNQSVEGKKGVDAHAFSYLAGLIYMKDQEGLERIVQDQNAADFKAIKELVAMMEVSWQRLAMIHDKVEGYSQSSGFASIDAEFVAAIVDEIPSGTDHINKVLARSKEINGLLDKASTSGFLERGVPVRGSTLTNDLINLIEQIKTQGQGVKDEHQP